ncbi:MAG: SDR family NAD(P)-dependent oxidoreductase [Candidatus Freyarchaeum deiterrae]
MTWEKKQIKESEKEKKEKKVVEAPSVKKAETGATLDKSKTAPETMEMGYVKGRLLGKNALVTGGSVGIGNGITRRFAREGAKVCFTYNTNKDEAKKTVNEIKEFGGEAMCIQCDVRNVEQVSKVVEETEASYGSIDILVNNAGIIDASLFVDTPLDRWDNMFKVHVDGTFLFCKAALKNMKAGGRVVNMSALAGISGDALASSYAAAKAAIIGLTKSLALEVAHKGITVNAIAPGLILAGMTKKMAEILSSLGNDIPAKRWGTVEDIASMTAYLASPEASYVTGQVIIVDGGFSLVSPSSMLSFKMMGL